MIQTRMSSDEHVRIAREEIERKNFERARRHLDEAIRDDSVRPVVFNLLGVIQEVQGETSDARTQWRIALLLDPAYAPARDNLTRSMRGPMYRGVPSLG